MDAYRNVDRESAIDPAADFVDTFYSYDDLRYEISAETFNGEEDSYIIDLYTHSRPLTPFAPVNQKDPPVVENVGSTVDCVSSSEPNIGDIIMQKKLEENSAEKKKNSQFESEKEAPKGLPDKPQTYSPNERVHVQN